MKTRSRQEIFDIVATHLINQGRKSTAGDGESCLYRSPDGLMCAAGALIPEDYELDMYENGAAFSELPEEIQTAAGVARTDVDFVGLLQAIHDADIFLEDSWSWRLADFATKHGLSTAALDAAVAKKRGGES